MNFHHFTSHPSISKSCFSDQLKLQKAISNNPVLPSDYHEAKRMIKPYLVQKVVFSACPNDCVVFRKSVLYDYADLQVCPVCEADRFHSSSVCRPYPKKRFIYIPLGPRLARIYGDANLAQIVQAHTSSTIDGEFDDMWDIHDSPGWRTLYSEDGFFHGDSMGLSFALELDGVNPFHNIGVSYSMTPIMLTLLNLPRHIRNLFGSLLLVGIIPGNGRSETSNVQPYVDILVDELIFLTGCTAYNEYLGAPTTVKIKLLLFILDYPGLSKLFNQHGSGSLQGCHWCWVAGEHCRPLDKVIYLSNRSFLQPEDPMRKDIISFKDKEEDNSPCPTLRTQQTESEYRIAYLNAANKTKASTIARATGSKGIYSLSRLPGHDRPAQCLRDACHTVKDVVHNIMNVITGKVNVEKIANAEKEYDRSHLDFKDITRSVSDEPGAKRKCHRNAVHELPFVLNKEEKELADKRAQSIRVPLGFGVKPSPFITHPGALKSHDWKQIATNGILKFCLRDCLDLAQRESLFIFFDCLSKLCSESHNPDELDQLELEINQALALLEKNFPLALQNITTHILHHVVGGIRKFGPVYATWMYVFERFNSWLCRRTLNRRYPEATAVETYIIFDWCQFMISSGRMTESFQTDNTIYSSDVYMEDESDCSTYHTVNSLKKSELKCLHNLHDCQLVDYTDVEVFHYYRHTKIHNITGRNTLYCCSMRETKTAQTISSFICFETNKSHISNGKISPGKYLVFGRIKVFVKHTHRGNVKNAALIGCYGDAIYDLKSGLWYVKDIEILKYIYVDVDRLSVPLVTAREEGLIWFLNSNRTK